jgi:hypothetical protein
MTHRRSYWNERRVLARELAALGERDAGLTFWRHVLASPHLRAAVTRSCCRPPGGVRDRGRRDAAGRTDRGPAQARRGEDAAAQALARLVAAGPGLGGAVPGRAGSVMQALVPCGCFGQAFRPRGGSGLRRRGPGVGCVARCRRSRLRCCSWTVQVFRPGLSSEGRVGVASKGSWCRSCGSVPSEPAVVLLPDGARIPAGAFVRGAGRGCVEGVLVSVVWLGAVGAGRGAAPGRCRYSGRGFRLTAASELRQRRIPRRSRPPLSGWLAVRSTLRRQ